MGANFSDLGDSSPYESTTMVHNIKGAEAPKKAIVMGTEVKEEVSFFEILNL